MGYRGLDGYREGFMDVTVMYEDRTSQVEAEVDGGDALWLAPDDFASATGWTAKAEGICRGSACVPWPADGSWTDSEGRIDLAAFGRQFSRPVVHDEEQSIWAFGESVGSKQEQMQTVQAPDFSLPDLDGEMHSLEDFRGKKVLLMSWGSYCGCRADLPLWEVLYQELEDRGFEIVAVALDAGGKAAVESSIRCPGLAEEDDAMATLMGWSTDVWEKRAAPSYSCLIDQGHVISDLFEINNVPVAVWIDEEGRIVRPAEPAGATDNHRHLDWENFGIPEEEFERLSSNRHLYWDAIRDWVSKGDESEFALTPDEVRAAMKQPDAGDVEAAVHARVGRYLFDREELEAAGAHFAEAARLCPDKWNYRRQSMVLSPERIGELNAGTDFFDAISALGNEPYYDRVAMAGIQEDPLVERRSESG